MSDSVRLHRRLPTRLPRPWDSPGKNTGVGCHFLLQWVKVKLLSRVRLLAPPWTTAFQASLSMGLSRQEYWSGVPLPSPIIHLHLPIINILPRFHALCFSFSIHTCIPTGTHTVTYTYLHFFVAVKQFERKLQTQCSLTQELANYFL